MARRITRRQVHPDTITAPRLLPEPIPDSPENVATALLTTPPTSG